MMQEPLYMVSYVWREDPPSDGGDCTWSQVIANSACISSYKALSNPAINRRLHLNYLHLSSIKHHDVLPLPASPTRQSFGNVSKKERKLIMSSRRNWKAVTPLEVRGCLPCRARAFRAGSRFEVDGLQWKGSVKLPRLILGKIYNCRCFQDRQLC